LSHTWLLASDAQDVSKLANPLSTLAKRWCLQFGCGGKVVLRVACVCRPDLVFDEPGLGRSMDQAGGKVA
ncbi:MAG: hypothetical protein ACKPKO_42005, partial [Candidatus Fonsibacter sp.]